MLLRTWCGSRVPFTWSTLWRVALGWLRAFRDGDWTFHSQ